MAILVIVIQCRVRVFFSKYWCLCIMCHVWISNSCCVCSWNWLCLACNIEGGFKGHALCWVVCACEPDACDLLDFVIGCVCT